ncbi:DUF1284 domain-containing protein [Sulfitobacter pacificus]|uniref:DUF1284 domain-containing protein n=1 Tax=Sulfitobacter pacificus TaxID=1499314 RepID=UPI00310B0139
MTIRLRAHHLLCLLSYVGKGYSPAFTDNMTLIAGRISAGETIEIVEGPDDICAPRLTQEDAHCHDESIRLRDIQAATDAGRVLQISLHTGAMFSLDQDRLRRLRAAFAQNLVRSACAGCQWGTLCSDIAANEYTGAIA